MNLPDTVEPRYRKQIAALKALLGPMELPYTGHSWFHWWRAPPEVGSVRPLTPDPRCPVMSPDDYWNLIKSIEWNSDSGLDTSAVASVFMTLLPTRERWAAFINRREILYRDIRTAFHAFIVATSGRGAPYLAPYRESHLLGDAIAKNEKHYLELLEDPSEMVDYVDREDFEYGFLEALRPYEKLQRLTGRTPILLKHSPLNRPPKLYHRHAVLVDSTLIRDYRARFSDYSHGF